MQPDSRSARQPDARPAPARPDLPARPDQILIEGLQFVGHHGVFDYERRKGCRFRVDLTLDAPMAPGAASDKLADTVDYGAVADAVLAVGRGESCHLLERLVERMADAVLDGFGVRRVQITLRKLNAPVDGQPSAVGVRVERRR